MLRWNLTKIIKILNHVAQVHFNFLVKIAWNEFHHHGRDILAEKRAWGTVLQSPDTSEDQFQTEQNETIGTTQLKLKSSY